MSWQCQVGIAAAAARAYVMEELTPDDSTTALLLHDDDEDRALEVAQWLLGKGSGSHGHTMKQPCCTNHLKTLDVLHTSRHCKNDRYV